MSAPHECKKLTPRAKQFAQLYVESYNIYSAYTEAGYSSAICNARNLFRQPIVQEEIARLQEDNRAYHKDIVEHNIEVLKKIAYGDIGQTIDVSSGSPVLRKDFNKHVIKDFDVDKQGNLKVKHYDKLTALDMLNRMMGAYQDKLDVTSGGAPFQMPTIIYEDYHDKPTGKEPPSADPQVQS